jgi:16S rRNA processing protein RimM
MSAVRPTLKVGYVARAHGIQGELAVRTFDPQSRVLEQVTLLVLQLRSGEERPASIVSARRASDATLLTLAGVGSRAEAEALRGASVHVHRADLAAPAAGEWFQGDLVGLEARTPEGASLGRVTAVWNTGPVPNLVIEDDAGRELLVPFVDEFVPEVDVEQGRLVVRPPEMME